MGVLMKALIVIYMFGCATSVAHAISGQAIVYGPPYVPSTCFGSSDKGVMILKAHSNLFVNGSACGTRYRVRCISGTNKAIRDACTGNTVDVMVVDRCETCASNEIKLSQEAFAKIARLALGRVNVEYDLI
ncbi:EG45-like domain containing protein isoform X2 [Rutidosis leptorrhynchoides]|uniref:EG45-like domain containing protein isoform X2 n=1 Tax=Rutidosis leptorrhynchoides TaxID=125765 RepID=UPI003A990443